MKKELYLLATAALLASCSTNEELGTNPSTSETAENAIGFQVVNKNATRATALNEAGHYNFGVFGYKTGGTMVGDSWVMKNYLVGYGDDKGGYKFTNTDQTTLASSNWAYEKLGSSEYTNTDATFYTASQTAYMSNNKNQYLKYWDYSSTNVEFFAYAPYINGANTATMDYTTKTLTIPGLGMQDGYDDLTSHEYMYAYTNVAKANYNNEVALNFKRLSAQIKIGFKENVEGYKVEILNLNEETGATGSGVTAAPAKANQAGNNYEYGTMYHYAGAAVDFTDANNIKATITGNDAQKFAEATKDHIRFTIPTGNITDLNDATAGTDATMSATKYFVIPTSTYADQTGLTFHVTYKLTSTDTGESIIVRNARVHVPYTYCQWTSNTIYTYIFTITKSSTGSTDTKPNEDFNPGDPTIDTTPSLYPIIFDGCTVEDWANTSSEHNIN